ncbi:MAG: type II secretion system F family protein [Candidatus Acidiferrales bacterium]
MDWTIATVTFVATAAVLGALVFAFIPGELGIAGRLSRFLNVAAPVREAEFAEKQRERVRETLASVGKIIAPKTGSSRSQLMMVRAGFRRPDAILAINGVKVLLPLALMVIAVASGLYRWNPVLVLALAALIGYLIPEAWLLWRIRARQHRLRLAIPDGLDLLVICVEAGLGLDHALLRVSEELQIAHPELSQELQLVNAEMRLGKTRVEALRELARRTGLDDIKSLVAMLVQTERFGTSIAQSLRVYSDDLRLKRRQRAEEAAAKVSVKMVPVLVFFIFPALMVVILGPAAITIMRQFLKIR